MEKTNEIRIRSIDLEKMILFFSALTKILECNKKVRVVVEHDPEEDRSVIEIFK